MLVPSSPSATSRLPAPFRPGFRVLPALLVTLAGFALVACSADGSGTGDEGGDTPAATGEDGGAPGATGATPGSNPYDVPARPADAGVSALPPWEVPDASKDAKSTTTEQTDAGTKPAVPAESCAADGACTAPEDIGSVSGDEGAGTISRQGSKSAWFSVRLTQNAQGWTYSSMKLRGSLIAPANAAFELHMYVDTAADKLQCTGPTASAGNGVGATSQASLKWDTGWLDYSDQSRTVVVEVRRTSGECRPNEKWSLLLEGNRE
ncbi:MAG: hypothetical protein U0169_21385 [Polyangiaceae bacterium]